MTSRRKVVVIGGGGAQAQAMLRGIGRSGQTAGWLALDRAWRGDVREATERLGIETLEGDPFASAEQMQSLLDGAQLVINMVGPYYRTAGIVLEAAIAAGADYMDICDDVDATMSILERDTAARQAGIVALVGMGSSPGMSNILIRAANDALGGADEANIYWTVDLADLESDAVIRHIWHCFNLPGDGGELRPVPSWSELDWLEVEFPAPVGRQAVVRLAHPEPLTSLRFLPIKRASNFGGVAPVSALVMSWALALATDARRGASEHEAAALELFRSFQRRERGSPRVGSGLIIDVTRGDAGFRYASGSSGSMDDATGIPAAAGALLMLSEKALPKGVIAPECLRPAEFFEQLGKVSPGGGGLTVHRLDRGIVGGRVRMRELLGLAQES